MDYGIDALVPLLIIGVPLFVVSMCVDLYRLRQVKQRRGAYRL